MPLRKYCRWFGFLRVSWYIDSRDDGDYNDVLMMNSMIIIMMERMMKMQMITMLIRPRMEMMTMGTI